MATTVQSLSPHCQALASPSIINFVLSILILVGILVSYLPQHIRIISRGSSFGISPYFVLLGTTSGTSAFVNILVLPRSAADAACCHEISRLACFAGLLGIFQVGVQCFCFSVILALFLIYFPRDDPDAKANPEIDGQAHTQTQVDPSAPTYRTALLVAATCILHALVVVVLSVTFYFADPSLMQSWANFLGILATVLSSIQYFPQIYTTFHLRHVGSLSIPMMCIQTPGSLVWAASLAARLGPEGWSAWGVYVVTAALQGTLLAMGVYFEYIAPEKDGDVDAVINGDAVANGRGDGDPSTPASRPRQADDGADLPVSEETPLLQAS